MNLRASVRKPLNLLTQSQATAFDFVPERHTVGHKTGFTFLKSHQCHHFSTDLPLLLRVPLCGLHWQAKHAKTAFIPVNEQYSTRPVRHGQLKCVLIHSSWSKTQRTPTGAHLPGMTHSALCLPCTH